jgi:hypothetical protein
VWSIGTASASILARIREARMARILRKQSTMRTLAITTVVWVMCSLGAGSRAFAEPAVPGATEISADHRTRPVTKPMRAASAKHRALIEQKMGMRVKKMRKGEKVAPDAVPELDPNAAGLALALLVGGALLFVDRRRSTRTDGLLPA